MFHLDVAAYLLLARTEQKQLLVPNSSKFNFKWLQQAILAVFPEPGPQLACSFHVKLQALLNDCYCSVCSTLRYKDGLIIGSVQVYMVLSVVAYDYPFLSNWKPKGSIDLHGL